MHRNLKMTIAIVGSFMLGAGAIQALHAQAKLPARRSPSRTKLATITIS
jgi:hypothetical protein